MSRGVRNVAENVWEHVEIGGPEECWPYTGGLNSLGYGQFSLGGKLLGAHRVAFAVATGQDPGELNVLHSCDNARCCNPAHLRLGTDRDNQRDCITRGRRPSREGSQNACSRLTESDVIEIRALRAAGVGTAALASRFSVDRRTIRGVVARESWRHV